MSNFVKKINEQTLTRFWVNNPVPSEAQNGFEVGVYGATSNPTYLAKMLSNPETKNMAVACIDKHIKETDDDHMVVELSYMDMIKKICDIFMPMWESTNHEQGWVCIQGNPFHDNEVDFVIEEAHRFYTIAPNIMVKVSATAAGVAAMEKLASEGHAALATAGVSNSYARLMFEAYERGVKRNGGEVPRQFVTSLAAPFEGYAKDYVKTMNVDIDEAVLEKCGIEMSKHIYKIWKEKYSHINTRLMCGGVRSTRHFLEMVGGDIHVTCNWEFIDELIQADPPIEELIDKTAGEDVIQELMEKIPCYKNAFDVDAFTTADLSRHPAFLHFRNAFKTSWDDSLSAVRTRRLMNM